MKQRKIPEAKPLFLERMQELLKDKKDYKKYLDVLKVPPVKSIRCNKLKISPEDLKKRLKKKGWKIKQPWKDYPEVIIVEGKKCAISSEANRNCRSVIKGSSKETIECLSPGELGRSIEHLLGYYYIQELASMLPIIALKPRSEENVLDLCASPGSKTTQIASELDNTGIIVANEINLGRIKILASNLERCGVTNTLITKKEGGALCLRLQKQKFLFDKILVDAPCSGEGTLRSSYKTYSMWNIKTVKQLPKIQKRLASNAFELLKPNGVMIYSTCTHAPEENEGVVNFMLETFKGKIKLEEVSIPIKPREGITEWKDEKFSEQVKKCARVYPHDNNTEGFFLARFRRLK